MSNEADNKNTGYIRLYRSMTKWEWYDDIPTHILFEHLLLTVNWQDKEWRGIVIPRGSRIASYRTLSEETGLSIQQVRTAFKHLESTGEVSRDILKKIRGNQHAANTLVTVEKYAFYQGDEQLSNKPLTSRQHAANTPLTPTKKGKKGNHLIIKKDNSPVPISKDVKEVVDYLNQTCGKHYRASSKSVQKFIGGRLKDGATVDEMKHVIDVKAKQWKDDQKMNQYLRPETLFNETKFESYRNETNSKPMTEIEYLNKIQSGEIKLDLPDW